MFISSLFNKRRCCVFLLLFFFSFNAQADGPAPRHFPPGVEEVFIGSQPGVRSDLLKNINLVVEKSIHEGYYPGAVVLAGHRGQIIYRGVFGNRRILPDIAPMQYDTIFDMASLTKVIATTPAVMQMLEQGKLNLDTPVAHYWPAFAVNGKDTVTIRHLLTHTSGLEESIPSSLLEHLLAGDKRKPEQPSSAAEEVTPWQGEAEALKRVEQLKLLYPPGTQFSYSNINFIILAHLVELLSGESFNHYVQEHIFKPLKMQHTFFLPPVALRDQIAPTQIIDKKLHWGEVHDPTAYLMGGISGMAGLFSTAEDLSHYAEWLLADGRIPAALVPDEAPHYLLSPLTVLKMTTVQTPAAISNARGLGWDVDSHYSDRGVLFPDRSFGHNGWTGTSIWIDPTTKTWVIILTSRTHPIPAETNQLIQDRKTIANIVAASITDITTDGMNNTERGEITRAYPAVSSVP